MSMAEQTFPVIEIDAGREITVTLTQGATLTTVKESPEKQQEELMKKAIAKNAGKVDYQDAPELDDSASQLPEM